MVTWSPTGLDVSPSFAAYVAELRETWTVEERTLATYGGDELPSQKTA